MKLLIICYNYYGGNRMDSFLIALYIILIIIILISILYVYLYNKFNDSIIRINEAENRIDNNLRDKYDLLNKFMSIVKSKTEIQSDVFNDLAKLKARKISNFDFDRVLVHIENEFLALYENQKELSKINEVNRIKKQIELINGELVTLRNYYNANITAYNKMIKKFPTLMIAMIKKYKEKSFYDLKNMTDEDYEDFKF